MEELSKASGNSGNVTKWEALREYQTHCGLDLSTANTLWHVNQSRGNTKRPTIETNIAPLLAIESATCLSTLVAAHSALARQGLRERWLSAE